MVPLVETAEQLAATRRLLCDAAAGDPLPPLGAMVETVPAVEHVRVLAGSADFLSIGTNDLAASVLGADRFAAGRPLAHHPRVLRAIADIAAAAREAGLQVEVCGEAASDPVMVPLLVGLGIDDLSVGAARVAEVRRSIRRLDRAGCAALANAALAMDSAEEVAAAVAARGAGAPRTAA
jgi:phosphoenolpyruvate-protein kinase (PTS system EI component)